MATSESVSVHASSTAHGAAGAALAVAEQEQVDEKGGWAVVVTDEVGQEHVDHVGVQLQALHGAIPMNAIAVIVRPGQRAGA